MHTNHSLVWWPCLPLFLLWPFLLYICQSPLLWAYTVNNLSPFFSLWWFLFYFFLSSRKTTFLFLQFSNDHLKNHIPWNCVSSLLLFSWASLITCGTNNMFVCKLLIKGLSTSIRDYRFGWKSVLCTCMQLYSDWDLSKRTTDTHGFTKLPKRMQTHISACRVTKTQF